MILKRIGVLSCGKIMGALYALIGLIIGAIISLLSLVGAMAGLASGEDEAIFGVFFGVGAILFMPILYGVFGFIGGLITAFCSALRLSCPRQRSSSAASRASRRWAISRARATGSAISASASRSSLP